MKKENIMVEIVNFEELSEEALMQIEGAGFLSKLQIIVSKSQFF